MMRSYLKYFMVLLLLISALSGCDGQEKTAKPQGGVLQQDSQKQDGAAAGQTTDELEDFQAEDKYVNRDNLKPMGETVEFDGIEYTVAGVTFSKDLGGRDPGKINFFDEERDENGRLKGAQSYIFLEFDIKNTSEETREELVNRPFVLIEKDNRILETGTECREIENPQEGHTEADAHHFVLKPGESAQVRAVYIVEDKYLTDELYFLVGNAGASADDARNRFIHVGSEVGR